MAKKFKQKKSKKGGKASLPPPRGFQQNAGLFPDRYMGRMTYGGSVPLAVAASSYANNVYRLNSVFDPDFSGVGWASASYTQAAALYNQYRVTRAEVFVTGAIIAAAGAAAVEAIIVASADSSLGADYQRALAQRHAYNKTLVNGGPPLERKFIIPVGTLYGVPPNIVEADDKFASQVATNPNNGVYLHVGSYNPNGAAVTVLFTVRIIYHVTFFSPLLMTQI